MGLFDSILFSDDGDQVLVLVLCRWEYDAGSSGVTYLADLATPFANEELVVLRLGADVNSETLGLLQKSTPYTLGLMPPAQSQEQMNMKPDRTRVWAGTYLTLSQRPLNEANQTSPKEMHGHADQLPLYFA